MRFDFFIANRLKADEGDFAQSSNKNILFAKVGMTMAIMIMILSISIVNGFKNEITEKIYSLEPHIKIKSYNYQSNPANIYTEIKSIESIDGAVNVYAEKPIVIKTNNDFKGAYLRGVDNEYNWDYFAKILKEGKLPNYNDSTETNSILISQKIAENLNLKVGDKMLTYFISENTKVRNYNICSIYNSEFIDFDNNYVIGSIKQLESLNDPTLSQSTYIGIYCNNYDKINESNCYIGEYFINNGLSNYYIIENTLLANSSYFTWLNLLDVNALVIIIIMMIVTSFTLISGMLMIVLKRVNMIGLLKALGTNNHTIRNIFIFLTNKLILSSMLLGNIIAISIILIQQNFHILQLDPESYYISYVPVELNIKVLLLLNIGIVIVSYISLLLPSKIVAKISPVKATRFE